MVMQSIPRNEHNSIDLQDKHLPDFLKTITNKQNVPFRANVYGKYNYHDFVLKCTHLSTEQQDSLIDLFAKYKELFSGNLGRVPGPPVSLNFKKKPIGNVYILIFLDLGYFNAKKINSIKSKQCL